jgi:hypothetical protein
LEEAMTVEMTQTGSSRKAILQNEANLQNGRFCRTEANSEDGFFQGGRGGFQTRPYNASQNEANSLQHEARPILELRTKPNFAATKQSQASRYEAKPSPQVRSKANRGFARTK